MLCSFEKAKARQLIVGTSADYPPFAFVRDGNIEGFDLDFIHAIAKELGYTVQIKDMPFSQLFPALRAKKIDVVIAALTATSDRMATMDFSMKYYLPSLSVIYLRHDPITKLDNKTVAAQEGSTMESLLLNSEKSLGIKIVPVQRTEAVLEKLNAGEVNCGMIELMQARIMCAQEGAMDYIEIQSSYDGINYALAFPQGSPLRYEVDNAILRLKISGEIDRLKAKWFYPTSLNNGLEKSR